MYNYLHLVAAEVKIALNEVTIYKACHWLRLLICVK